MPSDGRAVAAAPGLLGQPPPGLRIGRALKPGSRNRTARVRGNAACARRGSRSGRVLRTRLTSAALCAAGVAADADGDGEEGTGEGAAGDDAGDAPEAAEPDDVSPSPPPAMDPAFPGEHAFSGRQSSAACPPGRALSKTWVTTAAPIPKARTTAPTASRVLRREHRELCAVAGVIPTSISSSWTVMCVWRCRSGRSRSK